jgi:hypothetical protein
VTRSWSWSNETPGGPKFILHDAATGKQYPLGDDSKKLIHAAGGKILYAEKSADAAETIFVAEIVVSNARK